MSKEWTLPTWEEMKQEQKRYAAPAEVEKDEKGAIKTKGVLWIPDDTMGLELRVLVLDQFECGT